MVSIRSITRIALFTVTLCGTTIFACGDRFEQAPETYMVRMQTGVGTRCGRVYHVGPFRDVKAAQAWVAKRERTHPAPEAAPTAFEVIAMWSPEPALEAAK